MVRPTPRLIGSLVLGVMALFAAAVTRRPEPAVTAAPFLATGLVALLAMRPPELLVGSSLDSTRVLQGEDVELAVTLATVAGTGRVRLVLAPPHGVVEGSEGAVEIVVSNRPITILRSMSVVDWGALGPVTISIVTTDRLGMFEYASTRSTETLKALPRERTIRSVVSPRSLRAIAGAHLSRQRGDGIEFADTRMFVAGDRARDVNWRVSARREELWVDDRRPERSGEVVIFLDTFAAVGDSRDNTLRRSVEVAAAIADRHIAANDRVGLVDLGGVLRWVRPGGGTVQLYRIVETLIETEAFASSGDKSVDVLPTRALPRRCMVIGVSPLVDERGVLALSTLRSRGFDVAVIEVSPRPFVSPPDGRREELAHRLWAMERRMVRNNLRRMGVAVAEWSDSEPLDPVLSALGVFREAVLRSAR
jgi:uncharacterized protein (DUF58 family)